MDWPHFKGSNSPPQGGFKSFLTFLSHWFCVMYNIPAATFNSSDKHCPVEVSSVSLTHRTLCPSVLTEADGYTCDATKRWGWGERRRNPTMCPASPGSPAVAESGKERTWICSIVKGKKSCQQSIIPPQLKCWGKAFKRGTARSRSFFLHVCFSHTGLSSWTTGYHVSEAPGGPNKEGPHLGHSNLVKIYSIFKKPKGKSPESSINGFQDPTSWTSLSGNSWSYLNDSY